jgi:DNA-binding beta-propeller fold protein YncE
MRHDVLTMASASSRALRGVCVCCALVLTLAACGGGSPPPAGQSCTRISSSGAHGLLATVPVPLHPFGAVATRSGRWIFVSVSNGTAPGGSIAVLRRDARQLCLVRVVPMSGTLFGLTLTNDDGLLVVADYSGLAFVDAARAESGRGNAVMGSVTESAGAIALELALSKDGRYAFVANEADGTVGVIALGGVGRTGSPPATVVGRVQVSTGPVGDAGVVDVTPSPDGRLLYTVSRIDSSNTSVPPPECRGSAEGTLSVVDVARAEQDPSSAVLGRVPAGCGPVRVVLSSAGDVSWVTAQVGNQVLAFRTALLLTDPAHALIATAQVDRAPTGLALVENGDVAVVTNSNRYDAPLTPQTITLLDTKAVLAGRSGTLGTIPAGAFPRELSLSDNGHTLLLTNGSSGTVQLFDVARLSASLKR